MTDRTRRGNALVVALMMTTLLGFSAMSVDLGSIRVARSQLQAGLDAASLTGVGYLDGTDPGIVDAVDATIAMASRNTVLGTALSVTAADVHPGTWDSAAGTFTPWVPGDDPNDVNAIRVDHQAPDAAPALGTAAFGNTGYQIAASSTAIVPWAGGPAGSTSCFLPLAIPDCHLAGLPPGTNPGPMVFSFTPSPTDSVSWADPDANPNSNDVRDQLQGQCAGGEIELGDPIYVNEGQHNSAVQEIRDILNNATPIAPDAWDPMLYGGIPAQFSDPAHPGSDVLGPMYGNVLQGPVALVDGGADCSNVSFTGSLAMTGVAWAVIYDVKAVGGDKHIKVQLDLVNEHDIWGDVDDDAVGTNVFGVGPPALVNGG